MIDLGHTVGNYRITAMLGQGGMGTVFLGGAASAVRAPAEVRVTFRSDPEDAAVDRADATEGPAATAPERDDSMEPTER